MFKGAKTWKGVRGNLRFIISYKFWASLTLFVVGTCLGAALGVELGEWIHVCSSVR